MYNIKLMNKISPVIYDYLPKDQFNVSSHVDDAVCDAMFVRRADLHEIELSDRLLCIARAGAGVNNIPVDRCSERGIVVFNTPGANANAVKELVLCCIIGASRNVFEAFDWVQKLKGSDEEIASQIEKGKGQFVGHEVMGKTLGVIGLGAIGIRVANAAAAIGMNVIGFDPYLSVDHAWHISRGTHRAAKLDELLPEADFISLHIPQTPDTMHFLSRPEFSKMKRGVVIVNMARGGLVKEVSLFDAISDGIVSKYITDFPSGRMIGHEGVIAIPHLGASTPESEENCAVMAAQEVRSFLSMGTIQNSVNLPSCTVEPITSERLTVIHKNTPNMVGQITRVIAQSELNIADMVNKSRGKYAYTVLNLDHPMTPEVTQAIESIPDVIKIRDL